MRLTRALSWRPFALLWSAQTVSQLGDAIHSIALAWLVLQLTRSAAAMGIVLTAHLLPFVLFSLAGGVAVDRLPRLRVMIVSDLVRMVVVAALAGLIAFNAVAFWHLVALSALSGLVQAFFYPAYSAVVPELVASADRPSAVGLNQLSRRVSRLVGPAAGAALVASGGTAAAFALDALTYGVSAGLIVFAVRRVATTRAGSLRQERASAVQELKEGLTTVAREPWIWVTILMAAVTGITLAGPMEAVLPRLVSDHLHGDVRVLGLIESMIALGAIVAAIFLGSRNRLRRRGPVLYGAWIVFAIGVAAAGLPIGVGGVGAAAIVIGACAAIVGMVWANTLQDLVPSERLGRVSSIDVLGSSAFEPIGYVLAGIAADAVGPATVFVAGGLLSTGILSLALLHPAVRRLD